MGGLLNRLQLQRGSAVTTLTPGCSIICCSIPKRLFDAFLRSLCAATVPWSCGTTAVPDSVAAAYGTAAGCKSEKCHTAAATVCVCQQQTISIQQVYAPASAVSRSLTESHTDCVTSDFSKPALQLRLRLYDDP